MDQVRLPPLRIGFPYDVQITFEEGWLEAEDTVLASLRTTANSEDSLIDFEEQRDGDTVILSLPEDETQLLSPGEAIMDLVHVASSGNYAITSPRFLVRIEEHGMRNV